MNERIKELSEQAQLYARQGMGKCVIELKRFDKDAVSERYAKDFEEKFAQLIVRECMRMCDVAAVGYDTHNHIKEANGCCSAKEYIAEHFGVEE